MWDGGGGKALWPLIKVARVRWEHGYACEGRQLAVPTLARFHSEDVHPMIEIY